MWKTRFEMNTSHHDGFNRHRNLSSSSSIVHQHYSGQLPTVPRVREDSPSAIVRSTPPSSMPSLEILPEEDEDIPSVNSNNNEQSNLTSMTLPKQNSYQSLTKHQFLLPTIIESNDHEQTEDDIDIFNSESFDEKCKTCIELKRQDSFVATNTNYNQVKHLDLERNERTLNKTNEMIELTLDKRINELLQEKSPRQNQSASSSIDVNKMEICTPTTFKDITAFFENKVLAVVSTKLPEQKKILRAKRSLLSYRQMPLADDDPTKISSATDKETTIFHRRIKRIKTTHKSQIEAELMLNNSFPKQSMKFQQSIETTKGISRKKILFKRCSILLIFLIPIFVCFYLFHLTKIYLNSRTRVFPQQSIHSINDNLISQYGQFVRNGFFSLLDLFLTFLGQLFFHVDKYEYKNNIVYIVTSTYEHLYDWFSLYMNLG